MTAWGWRSSSRDDLRDAYGEVKRALAADPGMDTDTYIAGKSGVLQQVLEASGRLSDDELLAIRRLNDPDRAARPAGDASVAKR